MCVCVSKYRYGFVIYIDPHVCIFLPKYKQIHVIDEVYVYYEHQRWWFHDRAKKRSKEIGQKTSERTENAEEKGKNNNNSTSIKPKILFRKCNDLKMFCDKYWQHSDGDVEMVWIEIEALDRTRGEGERGHGGAIKNRNKMSKQRKIANALRKQQLRCSVAEAAAAAAMAPTVANDDGIVWLKWIFHTFSFRRHTMPDTRRLSKCFNLVCLTSEKGSIHFSLVSLSVPWLEVPCDSSQLLGSILQTPNFGWWAGVCRTLCLGWMNSSLCRVYFSVCIVCVL